MKKMTLPAAALLAVIASFTFGQGVEPRPAKQSAASADPYGNEKNAARQDARAIRAEREKCVVRTGEVSRRLVEEHAGAVAALNACSPEAGKKLAGAYGAGVLDKLKIDDILKAVANTPGGGDDAALWMIQPDHAAELQDPDACGAFCMSPLDAALGIRQLSAMAAEYRANRLEGDQEREKLLDRLKQAKSDAQQPAPANSSQEVGAWAAALGFIGLILAVLYAVKRWAGGGKQSFPVARREA